MSGGHTKAKRRLERVWYIVSTIAVLIILLFAIALVAFRVFGLQMFTVTSGSMEPNLPVGSLVYTTPANPSTLKAGDIITFANSENTIVTHRINEVITETTSTGEEILRFRTKGDANTYTDGKLVHQNNILGTPVITIPGLGYISYHLQRPPGSYIALVIGTLLVAFIIFPYVSKFFKRKEQVTQTVKA